MADIFISYAREDRERASRIADALEERGWSVWWDREMIVGKSFSEVIEREIATAKCVIVLWSGSSLKSRWVRNEAADGAARELLVPVLLDDSRLPLEFSHLHTASLGDWQPGTTTEQFEDLMSSVAALVTASGTPAVAAPLRIAAPPPASPSRIKPAFYISAAVIVLLLVLGYFVLQTPKRSPGGGAQPVTDTIATTTETVGTTETIGTAETTGTTATLIPPDDIPAVRFPPGSRAVGTLLAAGKVRCTAVLINLDMALTTRGCLRNETQGLTFRLGNTYVVESIPMQNQALDLAVLKLRGTPGRTFPPVARNPRTVRPGDTVTLVYHDRGTSLTARTCKVVSVKSDKLQYQCSVGVGAVGAPLFDRDDVLVGLHLGNERSSDRSDPLKRGIPATRFDRFLDRWWMKP